MGGTSDWTEKAACRGYPTALFFPAEADDDQTDGDEGIAKAICDGCPVQEECRAAQIDEPYGVRGRLSAEERGFKRYGKLSLAGGANLQSLIGEVLEERPDTWLTTDQVNSILLQEQGRRWPRNSVNAALLRLHRRGFADRDSGGELLLYRHHKETR